MRSLVAVEGCLMLQAGVTSALVRLSSFDGGGDMRLGNGTTPAVLPHLTYVVQREVLGLSGSCRIWWGAPGQEAS